MSLVNQMVAALGNSALLSRSFCGGRVDVRKVVLLRDETEDAQVQRNRFSSAPFLFCLPVPASLSVFVRFYLRLFSET